MAVSNTITTRITVETATSTIMTGMVIMITAGTRDSDKAWRTCTARAKKQYRSAEGQKIAELES